MEFDDIARWVREASASPALKGAASDPADERLYRYKAAIAEMSRLKSFLRAYPEIDADQALTFLRNTGDDLGGLAVHLDRARRAGVSLKHYFGAGQRVAFKDAPPEPARFYNDFGQPLARPIR